MKGEVLGNKMSHMWRPNSEKTKKLQLTDVIKKNYKVANKLRFKIKALGVGPKANQNMHGKFIKGKKNPLKKLCFIFS